MKNIKIIKNLITLFLIAALLCVFCSCSVTFSTTNTAKADEVYTPLLDYNIKSCATKKIYGYNPSVWAMYEQDNTPEEAEYSVYNVERHATSDKAYDFNEISIINNESYIIFGPDFYDYNSFMMVFSYGVSIENGNNYWNAYGVAYISDLEALTRTNNKVYIYELLNGVNFANGLWTSPSFENEFFMDLRTLDFYIEDENAYEFGLVPYFKNVAKYTAQQSQSYNYMYFFPINLLVNSETSSAYKYNSKNVVMLAYSDTYSTRPDSFTFNIFYSDLYIYNKPYYASSVPYFYIVDGNNDETTYNTTYAASSHITDIKYYFEMGYTYGISPTISNIPITTNEVDLAYLDLWSKNICVMSPYETVDIGPYPTPEEDTDNTGGVISKEGYQIAATVIIGVMYAVTGFIPLIISGIIEATQNNTDFISGLKTANNSLIETFSFGLENFVNWVGSTIQKIRTWIRDKWDDIIEYIKEVKDNSKILLIISALVLIAVGVLSLYIKFYGGGK